ncbi:glycosyltransferase [Litoreibacter arenae]|uniref:Mannosyltransferase OCH1 n=1 Tax=Litoreibacter arenae DSM 19593 TaxID=1123360 RepID=S9Q6E7_9RHOB|nr:glycosyltransferase [Litoreibacter arenae]EPX76956.1 hypothetical protein thalar_02675 [Litoreibacter arenae DSM 19593]
MARKLKWHHRLRIERLAQARQFETLDGVLHKLASKGFDVAGVPFQLLDMALSEGGASDHREMLPLARHTVGGQPQLLSAALQDLHAGRPELLSQLASDRDVHPMTRFEAAGWACYVAHRDVLPASGRQVTDVFQFWDSDTPPDEVIAGRADWRRVSGSHQWFSEADAEGYIRDGFGADAARGFARLWHPAVKSDLFRLYRLAQDGGLYCDADSKPRPEIAAFLAAGGGRVWASSMTNVPNCVVNNWFVAAPPKSPFIEALLTEVLANLANPGERGIFWLTGPGAYTGFLHGNIGAYDVGLLPSGLLKGRYFKQLDADYKLTSQNWRVYEHALGIDNDEGLARALG